MNINRSKLLVIIYADIEGYPPTMNQIRSLQDEFSEIRVLQRGYVERRSNFFSDNVKFKNIKKNIGYSQQLNGSMFLKMKLYISFILNIGVQIFSYRPTVILIYDPVALFCFSFVNRLGNSKTIIWYHNHDIIEILGSSKLEKVVKTKEQAIMKEIDIFSLPAMERFNHFDLSGFKGQFLFIPNYPSLALYSKYFKSRERNIKTFNLLFQGSIGSGHGLEEIINILGWNEEIEKNIMLHLKGNVHEQYKADLIKIANNQGKGEFVKFHPYTEYEKVPELASKCELGIAIFLKTDVMNSTLGTSSNKIYEYGAVGTPIVYFRNDHFDKYLGECKWAFPTDLSNYSLLKVVSAVNSKFDYYSNSAFLDFSERVNFELSQPQVIEALTSVALKKKNNTF
jgi:hypothetical protein